MNQLTVRQRKKSSFVSEVIKTVVSLVIVGLGFSAVVYAWLNAAVPETKAPSSLIPLVKTYPAQRYTGPLDLTVSGSVVPFREIKLSAEIGGIIAKKTAACEAGNFVKAGTELLVIDRESYELEVRTLDADVAQARAMLTELDKEIEGLVRTVELGKNELDLVRREFERNSKLSNVVSQSELDAAERAVLTSQSQLATRENNLNTTRARRDRMDSALDLSLSKLDRAELNLTKTNVIAPADGVIVKEHVQQGDFVSPGSTLITFEDTRQAEVISNLTTSDLAWIKQNAALGAPGQTSGEVSMEAAYLIPKTPVVVYDVRDPDVVWQGILERYDGIGRDERTKSIPVRIVVDQPVVETERGPRALVRGMYVKCRMQIGPNELQNRDQLLTFPLKGLRPGGTVWVVDNLELRKVKIQVIDQVDVDPKLPNVNSEEIMVVVRTTEGGLKSGDQIVITPLSQPSTGTKVELVNDALSTTPKSPNKSTIVQTAPENEQSSDQNNTSKEPVADDNPTTKSPDLTSGGRNPF